MLSLQATGIAGFSPVVVAVLPHHHSDNWTGDEDKHFIIVGNWRRHIKKEEQTLQQQGYCKLPCKALNYSLENCNEKRNTQCRFGFFIRMMVW